MCIQVQNTSYCLRVLALSRQEVEEEIGFLDTLLDVRFGSLGTLSMFAFCVIENESRLVLNPVRQSMREHTLGGGGVPRRHHAPRSSAETGLRLYESL